ncbi:uncharacterized protein [Cicer arietinum]|uniref:Uncharacterized protein LOC101501986 n=1 Tax=Cicer arietinum TaxID=3827 RepID=A0A1S2XRC7_CICAR|nr:uncharacterized protein LOC101501986 [Cicer arietinum]
MSSCISLRLPPASKVWKSITSKLGKLHNIGRSKPMKKHRKKLNTYTTTITPSTTSITTKARKFIATKRFRCKRLATVRSVFNSFHKKPAPVYIDKLFKDPPCDLVGYLKPQTEFCQPRIQKVAKKVTEGTSKGCDKACTSDDMCESVALASPQMQGIDERAEEFIIRFRQQMAAQEMLARNL